MDRNFATDLRSLIDHLALRGVAMLSVQKGDERLRITLGKSTTMQASTEAVTIAAAGPGIFHARHPGGADLACIEAGDFLFPVVPLCDGDEVLEQVGAVVGFGTPLIRKGGKA